MQHLLAALPIKVNVVNTNVMDRVLLDYTNSVREPIYSSTLKHTNADWSSENRIWVMGLG